MRAVIRMLSAAMTLWLLVVTPAHAGPTAGRGVWWEVDDGNKLVIAHAKVAVWHSYPSKLPGFLRRDGSKVNETELTASSQDLIKAFKLAWDGQPILCYKLRVDIDLKWVTGPDAIPADYVGVRLYTAPWDEGAYKTPGKQNFVDPYTRGYIASDIATAAATTYIGDAPINVSVPNVGSVHLDEPVLQSRVWVTDPRSFNMTHEFGHILGLNDNYDETGALRKDAVNDIMFSGGNSGAKRAFPESITKMVRRGGINTSALKCTRHVESTPVDMSLHAELGYQGLDKVWMKADNCEWLPPSSDPDWFDKMNVWKGTFEYSPRMNTPDNVNGFTVHPVIRAGNGKVVSTLVSFETVSWRDQDHKATERWHKWEAIKILKDSQMSINGEFELRTMDQVSRAENFMVLATFDKSWAYKSDIPMKIEIRPACR